jgi:UDP-N-acetylmuramate--alanine ligase
MSAEISLPASLEGLAVHLVGAKGTGMSALAEILSDKGARLSGSDVADVFYTDAILSSLGVKMSVGFDAGHLGAETKLVVHSAAYARDSNPELLEAARRGIAVMNYPEALGALSRRSISSGIAGVHGKTTTTALTGSLLSALAIPATVLAGSAVSSFGGRSTIIRGDRYFVAETCEYRRHFLNFRPSRIVLTSIESDHQDFYPTFADIYAAFLDYLRLLPKGGELIYCADDPGASRAAAELGKERPDLLRIPYGERAEGAFRLQGYRVLSGEARFSLAGFDREFTLHVPGRHLALDATAALALSFSLLQDYRKSSGGFDGPFSPTEAELGSAASALASFAGSKRRSEILGEAGGVLFMDDYGHHPTAVRETIRGIKEFWPDRRIVVDFMSHTYSRTKALFDDFVSCLDGADALVLHGIYASAREKPDPSVSGRSLCAAVLRRDAAAGRTRPVHYHESVLEGEGELAAALKPGDLYLTMGAGDNWKLGAALLKRLSFPLEGR